MAEKTVFLGASLDEDFLRSVALLRHSISDHVWELGCAPEPNPKFNPLILSLELELTCSASWRGFLNREVSVLTTFPPQIVKSTPLPFGGDEWLFEIKHDGL